MNQGQARISMTMQEVCGTMEKVQSYLIKVGGDVGAVQAKIEEMEKRLVDMDSDIKLQASETRNTFDDSKERMMKDQMKVQSKIQGIEKRLVDLDSDIKRQASETVHKVEDVKELVVDLI
jgi:prefoldin subunit 5